ncbi:MAG TPA: DUF3488 and transglutaminase-like domain-containing protein [Moraxellaceae bacterium]
MTTLTSRAIPGWPVRYWQSAALLVAVLPQFERLPYWLLALVVLACLWRTPFAERRLAAPGSLLRMLILMAGMAGVYYSHRTLLGAEGGVSFLIVCAVLKLLESRQQRDLFISVVLDFFVLATAFLFSTSLVVTVYVGLACVVIIAALLVQQQREGAGLRLSLRRAGVMALQALPLMLILFVFFPRLPPLWTLNLSQGGGRTGMSDSMSPGDISRLSESSELAFRVEFSGPLPPSRELYWRGLVLTHYDGQRWTQAEGIHEPRPASLRAPWVQGQDGTAPLAYRIILEPTDQTWLFALAQPRSPTPRLGLTRDNRLVARAPVFSRLSYDVQSWPQASADIESLPDWMWMQSVQLPAQGNPEAKRMARRWYANSGSASRYVADTLDWFRQEHFFYTLEPPALGENRVDDFLFKTRRGFCEHYASAFVFLMRAAGVPARVVAGYQGGEKSPLGDYWVVRQLDAHAWAEVWLEGQGWVQVDPTSAVAPDRVQRGATQLAGNPAYWGNSGLSTVRYNNFRLLKNLRSLADYVNYRWHRDVLGYDVENQEGLMQRLLGDTSLLRRLAVMGIALAVLAGLLFLWALRGERRQLHPLDRLYRRYCARLARQGVLREAGEGPQAFARRVARQKPVLGPQAEEFARLYMALRYQPARDKARIKVLEKRLIRLARGF